MNKKNLGPAIALTLAFGLGGCGYNALQSQDEGVRASWSEVQNQYQRRADLIPNLVNVVKGYAEHEQGVLVAVTEARAKAMQTPAPSATDAAAFEQYQKAQAALGSSLTRLMAVSESYPQLKADANFRDLQAQLEGTENRVAVARNRYIKSVQQYNTTIRSFPENLTAKAFGYAAKPAFAVENEAAISSAPKVDFGRK